MKKMLKTFVFLFYVILIVESKPLDDSPILSVHKDDQITASNVITVPNKCPQGQLPDANGVCKDVWGKMLAKNVITVPVICPDWQQADENGVCRDVWRKL